MTQATQTLTWAAAAVALSLWLAAQPPAGGPASPQPTPAPPPFGLKPSRVPGGEIFDAPTVLDFHVQLGKTNLEALRHQPREYTPATVVVNGQAFTNVAVKLKGAAGSFRYVDDQPALTVHFSKWVDGRRVFGLRRLHLNNSVQDPSFMNEYIGSELYRAAGVPTPRVAWATVRLNERPLGLYVLKEAFEKEFLRTFFGGADGNLYDGGFVRDIDQDLERESGEGPTDGSDLKTLVDAAREPDLPRRWERLQEVLDVDRFIAYAALSALLVDWDGYPLNRNNYRVYFQPEDGRAVFLPHGMDQLFQRSYLELDPGWGSLLGWSLFTIPAAQQRYEDRCRELYTNVFRLDTITNLIARLAHTLRPVQPDIEPRAETLEYQVKARFRNLRCEEILKPLQPVKPPNPTSAATPNPVAAGPLMATTW
ncbi:MAG: hypothetical protein FJ387_08580 [Verrucomicrobia bacterium]|nr:hypothetical protein [Verrucomicrobiota bacterium]